MTISFINVTVFIISVIYRFSNLEILAKMEEEMEEKERLERGEPPKEKKEEAKKEETLVEGEKENTASTAEVKKEESGQASAVNSREDLKMSRENSYDRWELSLKSSSKGNQLKQEFFFRMEHSKSELDLGYQGPEARRSQWEDWEGWNPPSHHSCHYPEDWARCGKCSFVFC